MFNDLPEGQTQHCAECEKLARERNEAQSQAAKWFDAAYGLAKRLKVHRGGMPFPAAAPTTIKDWLSYAVLWGEWAPESAHREALGFFARKEGK